MPTYSYECADCVKNDPEHGEFLTYYSIAASEETRREATICPTCHGSDTHQVYSPSHVIVRQRGNWPEYHAKNKVAMARDRDLHTLKSGDDPFAEHRAPDETAQKIDMLEKAKKVDPKRQYFT